MAENERIPVLVVGGGMAGLCASLFLSVHGVRSILVERHEGTSIYPRSRGVNGRTMELMRELGIADEIRKKGERLAPAVGFLSGTSLCNALERTGTGGFIVRKMRERGMRGTATQKSPTGPCRCTQDELEPILLRAARERGVDARFSTEATNLVQDLNGVTATLRDRKTGAEQVVRADYVVAADGARSPIRTQLGIERTGSSTYGHQLNVLFHADLRSLVSGREFSICFIEGKDMRAGLASIDNATRWVIHIAYDPENGEKPEDFTPTRLADLVRKAIGISDLEVEIKGATPWQSSVRIADRLREKRIFLAGDAAHSVPPWGGFGGNMAVQDVHNLAWKLALVLEKKASDDLLATYEVERLPVARACGKIAGSMNGDRGLMKIQAALGPLQMLWSMRKVFPYMTMGYGYTSSSVAIERGSRPGPGTNVLDGRPGTRAPHVWLERDGKKISTLDLIGRNFVLFAGKNASEQRSTAADISAYFSLPIDFVEIEETRAFGISTKGSLLVRPDGIVAWRSKKSAAPGSLKSALTQILARA